MRVTTSALGTLGIILATAGIIRASGVAIDIRIFVVIALLTLSLLLAASAFVPQRHGEETDDLDTDDTDTVGIHTDYTDVRVAQS